MVCACYLLFQATYFAATLGYPCYCLYELQKKDSTDKKWMYYFFFLSFFYLLEGTLLYPLKYLLNKICFCMFPTVKILFAIWLYNTKYSGIDLFEEKLGKHLDTAFLKINTYIGRIMEKIGIENRAPLSSRRKVE